MKDPSANSNAREIALLLISAALVYFPFVNKALHIDSDLLVHTAHQLLINPINPPLGEYGRHMVLHEHTHMPTESAYYRCGHPPLLPLYLAPVAAIAKNHDWPYHVALFPSYLMSIFGMWLLLGLFFKPLYRFGGTLIWMFSPALLVNSHNVMWDVTITGFILVAFYFFLDGMRKKSAGRMLLAGIIAGLGALTKTNILPLYIIIPIFLFYKKEWKLLLLWCIPAAFFPGAWVLHNILVFGKIQYVSVGILNLIPGDIRYRGERNISYFGGALMLPVFWYWLIFALKRFRLIAVCTAAAAVWGILLVKILHYPPWFGIAYTVFAAAGAWVFMSMCAFPFRKVSTGITREERFLLWAYAILSFGILSIMPSANLRYFLPMVPVILLIFFEELQRVPVPMQKTILFSCAALNLLFSVTLAWSDYLNVEADRNLPLVLKERGYNPQVTWYYGRLSYDYYMFRDGFSHIRLSAKKPATNEYVIERSIPADYSARVILGNGYSFVPVDTVRFLNFLFAPRAAGPGFMVKTGFPIHSIGHCRLKSMISIVLFRSEKHALHFH